MAQHLPTFASLLRLNDISLYVDIPYFVYPTEYEHLGFLFLTIVNEDVNMAVQCISGFLKASPTWVSYGALNSVSPKFNSLIFLPSLFYLDLPILLFPPTALYF